MNLRLCLIAFVAAALLGCREKPAASTVRKPAPGAEIALFQIGMSEDAVQNAIPAIPNFKRLAGDGFVVAGYGDGRSGLEAKPQRNEEGRPQRMRFTFEAQRLVQVELTYRADDAAARGALYDRLLNGLAGGATHATNQVLDWGGRVAWLHVANRLLVVHEARADARSVTARMSPPVFR